MARYVNVFQLQSPSDALFNSIHSYLMTEGYEYTQYKGETVFKKGMGFLTGPTFVKVTFTPVSVCLEAWMKFALLPGVYVSEMDLEGIVGIAVKAPLKARVALIESMIMQYGGIPTAPTYYVPQYAPRQPVPPQYAPQQPAPQQYTPRQPAPPQYAPQQPAHQQYPPQQPTPQQYPNQRPPFDQ